MNSGIFRGIAIFVQLIFRFILITYIFVFMFNFKI
nr:MAG TPA: hypothetical protein [Caudoviricetes sp.]DAR51931.1 MAG TPA: hypothetical protein [Caudoviricetes sp.]DAZ82544.1 MAG TPA: hypothetical protein [Caudoviricetes sp.]